MNTVLVQVRARGRAHVRGFLPRLRALSECPCACMCACSFPCSRAPPAVCSPAPRSHAPPTSPDAPFGPHPPSASTPYPPGAGALQCAADCDPQLAAEPGQGGARSGAHVGGAGRRGARALRRKGDTPAHAHAQECLPRHAATHALLQTSGASCNGGAGSWLRTKRRRPQAGRHTAPARHSQHSTRSTALAAQHGTRSTARHGTAQHGTRSTARHSPCPCPHVCLVSRVRVP
jgi:hypothetical protein